jgi:hypothetical protein
MPKPKASFMQKGESIISIALTLLLVLVVLAIQKQWSPATFEDMASSAEDYVLKTTGLRGRIPDLPGYEQVNSYRLGRYRAVLYRAVPSPLVFASYRFVIFDHTSRPVYRVDSVESTTRPWTALYDFAGIHGRPDLSTGGRPSYARDLTGDGAPDALLGQYSGGDHCCTTVSVIELGKDDQVRVLARVGGLDGLPFEGLDIRSLDRGKGRELVAHRPYQTLCGQHADAADVLAVYAYDDGKFTEQTARFSGYLNQVLQQNLARWNKPKGRSLHLLQTLATNYSEVGNPATGDQFFETNLPLFSHELRTNGVDPQACVQAIARLTNSLSHNQA